MFNFIKKAASTVADIKRLLLLCVLCFPALAWAASCEVPDEYKSSCQAAEQGDAWAQGLLGGMYYNGKGVKQDYHQAFLWTQKAAEQGEALAQNRLGDMYYLGKGVKQDYHNAFLWAQKAADKGDATAQNRLGAMYYLGEGVRQNKPLAKEWFGKSCDNGYQVGCDSYKKLNESGY